MEDKKQSKIVFAVIGIAILLTLAVGLSFAIYSYSETTTSENSISTGTISMSFTESSNIIKIDDALPVTSNSVAKTSKVSGEYFDFSVSSTVDKKMDVPYSIIATKITTTDDGYTLLPDASVYLYLTKVVGDTETMVYDNTADQAFKSDVTATLFTTKHEHAESGSLTTNYRLRVFIPSTIDASTWSSTVKYEYKVRIDVSSTINALS